MGDPWLCLGQKEEPSPEVRLQNREDTLGVGKEEDVSNGEAPEGHRAKLIQPPLEPVPPGKHIKHQ